MIVFVSAAKRLWPLTYICISRLLWDVKNILGVTAKYKKSVALGWKSYFKYVSQIPLHYNPKCLLIYRHCWWISCSHSYKKVYFYMKKKKMGWARLRVSIKSIYMGTHENFFIFTFSLAKSSINLKHNSKGNLESLLLTSHNILKTL